MKTKLSERIRPDCEAAPWVVAEVLKLEQQLARYKDALLYARHQSFLGHQLRGIEVETYCAWIHERCSKALHMRQSRWRAASGSIRGSKNRC